VSAFYMTWMHNVDTILGGAAGPASLHCAVTAP
jgi:hypothetical protein